MLVIPDDDMVEDIDADDLPGFDKPFRQADILLGGGNIAGRVIMHKYNGGRAGEKQAQWQEKGIFYDGAAGYPRPGH